MNLMHFNSKFKYQAACYGFNFLSLCFFKLVMAEEHENSSTDHPFPFQIYLSLSRTSLILTAPLSSRPKPPLGEPPPVAVSGICCVFCMRVQPYMLTSALAEFLD